MKTLLIEDEPLIREALATFVREQPGFSLLAEAHDGDGAWRAFQAHEAELELVILDIFISKTDGLELAQRMLLRKPDLRILALSRSCDEFTVNEVVHSKISGLIDKHCLDAERFRDALTHIGEGRCYYCESVQAAVAAMKNSPDAYYKILTRRELQVIRLLGEGNDLTEVGRLLGIRSNTVRRHKHNAMRKIEVNTEAGLIRYAMKRGIIRYMLLRA